MWVFFVLRCDQHLEHSAVSTETPTSVPGTSDVRISDPRRYGQNIHRNIFHFPCQDSNSIPHNLQANANTTELYVRFGERRTLFSDHSFMVYPNWMEESDTHTIWHKDNIRAIGVCITRSWFHSWISFQRSARWALRLWTCYKQFIAIK